MSRDQGRTPLERREGLAQCRVPLVGRGVEPIVCGHLARSLPDGLDGVQFWRVRRQPVQLNGLAVGREPGLSFVRQVVTRGVVDDKEDLATSVFRNEALQERPEGVPVEDVGEPVGEAGVVEGNCSEQMCGLAPPEGIDAGLAANSRPCSVKRAVKPKAGFVLEKNYAATGSGFFLIRGNVVRIQ